MDGKLFLYSSLTPPRMVYSAAFVFDLQRFSTLSDLFNGDPEAGYSSSSEGKYFKVSSDEDGKNNVKYFNNIHAALNYIYTTDAYKVTNGSDNVYTGTITLLTDITDGQPFMLGGQENYSNGSLSISDSEIKKGNITINLGGFNYHFSKALTSSNSDASKSKAITIRYKNKDGNKNDTDVTIKNGSITVAEQSSGDGALFERVIKNDNSGTLTLESVNIDATNLKGQFGGEDGAAICQANGTLNLSGSTTIKVNAPSGEDIFYAIGAKLNAGRSGAIINVNTTGSIPNIGLYGWIDPDDAEKTTDEDKADYYKDSGGYPTNFSPDKIKVNVTKGTIGEITVDGVAVDRAGYTSYSSKTKVDSSLAPTVASSARTLASASNITWGENAHSLASFGLFDQVTTSAAANAYVLYQKNGEKYPYTLAKVGWNRQNIGDDTELNYVASLDSDDQPISTGSDIKQGKGDWLINVKNVSDKADLVLDTSHKIFGIPTSATAELKNNNYKLVNVKYNTAKDAVTLTGGDYSKDAFIAPKTSTTDGILAESIKTIDASDISVAVSIIGNTLGNEIYDGKGDNVVSLGSGVDTLIFGGGADSIKDFASTDFIKLTKNIDPVTDASKVASLASDGFVLGFGTSDSIKLQDYNSDFSGDGKKFLTGVNVEASNGDNYVYTKQSIAYKAKNSSVYGSLTFTSELDNAVNSYDASNESTFYTIDAGAVGHGMQLTGEGNDNRLIGSKNGGNRLYGKAGNDFLQGGTVAAQGDVFVYSDGNDTIDGFKYGDKASVTSARLNGIASAKLSRNKLVFTVDKNNSLTFNIDGNDSAVEKISLEDGGFLTEAGHADFSNTANKKFRLFAGAKGNIDLVSGVYKDAGINAIDATAGKNSVTLTADSVVSSLALAANKKRDQFVYGGGNITISGFETGKDRINIAEVGPINAFSVGGGDVAISVTAGTNNVISLKGAAGEEVLMHDFGSKGNSYQKFVFAKTGVLYNKAKKPTEATIYQNVDKENPFTAEDSVKKIFLQEGVAGVSIQSADNKATLDASAAGNKDDSIGVSLVGGKKNNKFIGTDYADTFYYYGGKDNITNFQVGSGTADSIVLSDTSKFDINEAKITLSRKSLKFKFDNKNTLALKSDSAIESLTIGTETYKFAKNAIGDGEGKVTLTSAFSGTYKLADGVTSVDGGAVLKNLTFKGTSEAESLVGGQKKTTFKGNGGDDTLKGGSGKDIFFYAKGDKGDTEIQNFDFGTDKLKIANGTLHTITVDVSNNIHFGMTSGKKGDENEIASFSLTSYSDDSEEKTLTENIAKAVVFKANNTHYWFAQDEVTGTDESGTATTLAKKGDLITWDKKVTARDVAGLDVIDLGYSTNLVKTGVAVKVSSTATNAGLPTKTTTPTTTP